MLANYSKILLDKFMVLIISKPVVSYDNFDE